MKKNNLWLKRALVISVCAAMTTQPSITFAEELTDITEESSQELSDEIDENVDIGDTATDESQPSEDTEQSVTLDESDTSDELEITDEEDLDVIESSEDAEEIATLESDEESTKESEEDLTDDSELATATATSGTCGTNVKWTLKDGVLTISGSGSMDDFYTTVDLSTGKVSSSHQPGWDNYRNQILEVNIQSGVTSIGSTAFANCSNLTKVVIGNSVKIIGRDAFTNDSKLTSLSIGNSVQTIYDDAFYGVAIKKLTLPSSLKTLSSDALTGMSSLEEISISNNSTYKTINGALFKDNGKTLYLYPSKRTGEYTIPSSVTKIADNAFVYNSLTKITIPNSVTSIGQSAFSYSRKLKTLIFGKGSKNIPYLCCYYCTTLSQVTIPEGVTTIANSAFAGCTALKQVTLPSTVTNLGNSFPSTTKINTNNVKKIENGTSVIGVNVNVQAKDIYSKAFEVLTLVNKERKAKGLKSLVMDQSLLETAMQRAHETVLYWDHTRPCGQLCYTANTLMYAENIAIGSTTSSGVMNLWMNSEDHKANILGSRYTSIGIGCIYYNGTYYWVQCFGTETSKSVSSSSYKDQTKSRKVVVSKDSTYYKASIKLSSTSLKKGQTATASVLWNGSKITNSGAQFKSSNQSVCKVDSNGKITATGIGTATISVYFDGYKNSASSKKITVTAPSVKLTFNANGGSVSTKSKNVTQKSKAGTLPSPTRKGYSFSGWYTAKSGGTKVTSSTTISKALTLYAHWSKITVAKASINKVANTSASVARVYINKLSGATGYKIFYSDNSSFKNSQVAYTTSTSATLKNLKKNKTYYVRIRAYRMDSAGKPVYGAYSTVKKVTIKK